MSSFRVYHFTEEMAEDPPCKGPNCSAVIADLSEELDVLDTIAAGHTRYDVHLRPAEGDGSVAADLIQKRSWNACSEGQQEVNRSGTANGNGYIVRLRATME